MHQLSGYMKKGSILKSVLDKSFRLRSKSYEIAQGEDGKKHCLSSVELQQECWAVCSLLMSLLSDMNHIQIICKMTMLCECVGCSECVGFNKTPSCINKPVKCEANFSSSAWTGYKYVGWIGWSDCLNFGFQWKKLLGVHDHSQQNVR